MTTSPEPETKAKNKAVPETEDSFRTTVNLVVLIVCILLFSAGYFLMTSMDKLKKTQICLESGNKACQRIEPNR